ncbi:hypothetical protein MP228_013156 [Amoeboaphelidium protococcarum]|nr:hypothetical protein MP228_013156 [Amoeboaphelidium protococcarum]
MVSVSAQGPSVASIYSDAVKCGWLIKKGGSGFSVNWRKRYFVLHDQHLHYYKNADDKSPSGSIYLPDYTEVRGAQQQEQQSSALADKKHLLILSPRVTSELISAPVPQQPKQEGVDQEVDRTLGADKELLVSAVELNTVQKPQDSTVANLGESTQPDHQDIGESPSKCPSFGADADDSQDAPTVIVAQSVTSSADNVKTPPSPVSIFNHTPVSRLRPSRTYYLQCQSDDEMQSWIDAIKPLLNSTGTKGNQLLSSSSSQQLTKKISVEAIDGLIEAVDEIIYQQQEDNSPVKIEGEKAMNCSQVSDVHSSNQDHSTAVVDQAENKVNNDQTEQEESMMMKGSVVQMESIQLGDQDEADHSAIDSSKVSGNATCAYGVKTSSLEKKLDQLGEMVSDLKAQDINVVYDNIRMVYMLLKKEAAKLESLQQQQL